MKCFKSVFIEMEKTDSAARELGMFGWQPVKTVKSAGKRERNWVKFERDEKKLKHFDALVALETRYLRTEAERRYLSEKIAGGEPAAPDRKKLLILSCFFILPGAVYYIGKVRSRRKFFATRAEAEKRLAKLDLEKAELLKAAEALSAEAD